jgi:hypothetical protein
MGYSFLYSKQELSNECSNTTAGASAEYNDKLDVEGPTTAVIRGFCLNPETGMGILLTRQIISLAQTSEISAT